MGLFDEISALTATRKGKTLQKFTLMDGNSATLCKSTGDQAAAPTPDASTTGQPETRRPPPATVPPSRPRPTPRKPERLTFLQPCPLCEGRQFIHGAGGGFFCVICQPGQQGQLVEAAGPDRQAPTITPEDLKPAGDIDTPSQADTSNTEPTEQQRAYFRAAWPWITKKREILLAAGWTPATLFRRAKYRWPSGPWGVAWLPVWSRPGVEVTIGQRGEIIFTYSSGGRVITQATHVEKSKTT